MIVLHIPIYIFYFINKINKIINYIKNEMDSKGYKIIKNNKKYKIKSLNSSLNIETTKEMIDEDNKPNSVNIKKSKKKSKFHKTKIKDNPPKKRKKLSTCSNINYNQIEEIKIEEIIQNKTYLSSKNKNNNINNMNLQNNINLRNENKKKVIKFDNQNNNLISELYSNELLNQNTINKRKIKNKTTKNKVKKEYILENSNKNLKKEFPLILIQEIIMKIIIH